MGEKVKNPKKSLGLLTKPKISGCVLFAELRGLRGHYYESSDCFEHHPIKSRLKSSHPEKFLPDFLTPKNPSIIPVTWNPEYLPPPRPAPGAYTLRCSNVKVHFICGNGCQWYVWCREGWPDKCAGPLAQVHSLYGWGRCVWHRILSSFNGPYCHHRPGKGMWENASIYQSCW